MEFTTFRKKEDVSDDELINAVLKFESALAKQDGIIFHCLVRNFKNEYANVLFAENPEHLHSLNETIFSYQEAKDFFALIEADSANMVFHKILKDNFLIPEGFAFVEHGTFQLKDDIAIDDFIKASNDIEKNYLNNFDNCLAHFVGKVNERTVSEIAIGKTYATTKQICYGYFDNRYGQALLSLANMDTASLDFWYLIA